MRLTIACIMAATMLPPLVHAQEKPPATYRLRFRLQESRASEQRTTRSYVLLVQSRSRAKINASRRLPFYTSAKGDVKELHTAALGNIIECVPEGTENGVRLDCSFESSYVAPDQPARQLPIGFPPIVNTRQASTTAWIALGPEVQLASLDDPSSQSRVEVFVSAERLPGGAAQ